MDYSKIIEIAAYSLPSVITGGVAYYFFNSYLKNEEGRRRFLLHKESQKTALPLRLQAYERMALFLERINPGKLLVRIAPLSTDKNDYEALLIRHIEQEFEHNLTQQVYISDECWNIILTAKNTIIQTIRKTTLKAENADKLREMILTDLMESQSPTVLALSFIKNEITEIIG
ncbi:hypothetical protein FSS13T_19030 [Flavobacterium saliperosum S13]|uniref:Uncharacterized protein n=2 Tax=Flavobacterium saliperosum TaxID=329186 RepID=A0A1G4W7Z7_9FLAO|nr:hypothetical protein [Flavobacterium saliperosum]ESU24673.1 hypothetical protein FSS13T_19030 [Flavobacterium saliperosum S13]SCX18299.1 hypothetical protein SAMN02927925_02664 [Flavobacterium saliperosum]